MTFWAKLLTVIILLLSVFFAATSAILFAKRTEWRQEYGKLKLNADGAITAETAKEEKLDLALQTAKADRDQLRTEKATAEATAKVLEDQVVKLQINVENEKNAIAAMTPVLDMLKLEHENAEKRLNERTNERDTARAEVSNLTGELTASRKEARDLKEQNVVLADNLQKTKENLAAQTEMRKARDEQIAHLYDVFPNMRTTIDMFAKLEPRINGKVLALDEPSGIVILNVGAKAEVKKEYRFTVYRGGEFKGMLRIFDVNGDNLSAGRVEYLAKDAQGNPKKIEIGDDVATAIGN
jgi:predicted  nucleic acid-binding Zn-ribbon protein